MFYLFEKDAEPAESTAGGLGVALASLGVSSLRPVDFGGGLCIQRIGGLVFKPKRPDHGADCRVDLADGEFWFFPPLSR